MEHPQQRLTPAKPVPAGPTSARFDRYLAAHGGVEGWFCAGAAATWDALLERQRSLGTAGDVLQIGVWHGKSAALLGLHTAHFSERLILVDASVEERAPRAALAEVGVEWSQGMHHLQVSSEQLASQPLMQEGAEAFRWIHVGGERTFGAVTRELAAADQLLHAGGIVCVDDFFNWLYPQVTEAVLGYVREHPEQFSLFLCGFNMAYLARPQTAQGLRGHCAGPLAQELEARGVRATIAKTSYPAGMDCFAVEERLEGLPRRGPQGKHSQASVGPRAR